MLIAVHGVKHYAHFYTWIEALCSLLYRVIQKSRKIFELA